MHPTSIPAPGRRIAIYGNSGAGKTTLGRALGEALGVPHIELDAVFHASPNWVDLPVEEFRRQVDVLLEQHSDGWVMDGNYGHVRDLILGRADTAVSLTLPFHLVYWRLAKRTLSRAHRHAELWNGNYETWRQTLFTRESMLWWGISAWRRSRRDTAAALAAAPSHVTVIALRSPGEVRRFLAVARSKTEAQPSLSASS